MNELWLTIKEGKGDGGGSFFDNLKRIIKNNLIPIIKKNQGEVDLELFNAILEDLETNASKIEQRRRRGVRSGE